MNITMKKQKLTKSYLLSPTLYSQEANEIDDLTTISYTHKNEQEKDSIINMSNKKYTKLLSPSTKEWPNSTYSFNKSYMESTYYKTQAINKVMREYFNFTIINKNSKNSKRMRDLVRRSSTKKFFISRPEIKQSNDKIIYTVYVFNREKNFYSKKIYLLNKSLARFNKYKLYNIKDMNNKEIYSNLSKIRITNRLGTINKFDKQATKLFSRNTINRTFLPKSLFLRNTVKGLMYYVNTYNTTKQKSLLELKTKALKKVNSKNKLRRKASRIPKNRNKNMNPLMSKSIIQHSFKYTGFSKKKIWHNLLKNKNNSYFSNKLLNLLTLSFNKKQVKGFKSIFFFNFLTWSLSRFDLKIAILANKLVIKKNNELSLLVNSESAKSNSIRPYIVDGIIATYNIPSYPNKQYTNNPGIGYTNSRLLNPINQSTGVKMLNIMKFSKLSKKLKLLRKVKSNRLGKRLKVLNKIKLKLLNSIKLNRLNRINTILFKILLLALTRGEKTENYLQSESINYNNKSLEKNVNILFKQFKNRYLWEALKISLMKQLLGVYYLYKNAITEFKYNKFLVTLKSNLLKIYNKTPYVNIVHMKYLHLNSDTLMEGIAIKLKNKKTKLLRTVKRALKLIKLPESVRNNDTTISNTFNKYQAEVSNTSITNNLYDLLTTNLAKMFSVFSLNNDIKPLQFKQSGNKNILNYNSKEEKTNVNLYNTNVVIKDLYSKRKDKLDNLRHKWITGIKVEGKGRLTRRYRADRSLFKLKYKGNLKNINFKDIYGKNHLALKRTQSMTLLKGHTTPNIQYSFKKWKRHIGSYGIKGWISNN